MSEVPQLAYTPNFSVDAEDIRLPKLYVGQPLSKPVQDGLAKAGDLYVASGADATDVQVVAEKGDEEGVLVYFLNSTKRLAYGTGDDFRIYDYNDPNAPVDAYPTWTFDLALPEVDGSQPYKLSLSRSGSGAAKYMLTAVAKNPRSFSAFRLTTLLRENAKGRWFVVQPRIVEAEPVLLPSISQLALDYTPAQPQPVKQLDAPAI